MQSEDSLPGVTFRLVRAEKLPPAVMPNCKARGTVELAAEIYDFDVWDAVLKKLNNMRVYTVGNLAEEAISVVQKRAEKQEEEHKVKVAKLQSDLEWAQRKLLVAQDRLQAALQDSVVRSREMARLQRVEQELQQLLADTRDLGG